MAPTIPSSAFVLIGRYDASAANSTKPDTRSWSSRHAGPLAVAIIVGIVLVGIAIGYVCKFLDPYYRDWKYERMIKKLAKEAKKAEEDRMQAEAKKEVSASESEAVVNTAVKEEGEAAEGGENDGSPAEPAVAMEGREGEGEVAGERAGAFQ